MKVTPVPALTLPALALAVTARSARRGALIVTLAEAFSGFGSIGTDDPSRAVLTISPVPTTVALIWRVALAPAASWPMVHNPLDGS